jgi:SAM-dependent methyltransferase
MATLAESQDEIERFGINPHYERAYRGAEFSYWRWILAWMNEDFRRSWPKRCLDVGCAYGTLLLMAKRLSGCGLYGIDSTTAFMSQALAMGNGIDFKICNIELEPLPWRWKFDAILMTEVLEHFNFQAAPTLRKLRDALAPAGRIYLSTPDAAEWGRVTKYYRDYASLPLPSPEKHIVNGHIWQFSEDELRAVIADAGLRVTRMEYAPGAGHRHFNVTLEAA